MYRVELYTRVRRACMVEGMSTREAARVFGLHRECVGFLPRRRGVDPRRVGSQPGRTARIRLGLSDPVLCTRLSRSATLRIFLPRKVP